MNREWNGWLQTIGAQVVPQAEFTWGRLLSNGSDTASWTYEVLDVVGSSIVSNEHGMQAFARRADDVLHPRVSDHWPVGLRWLPPRTRGERRRPPADSIVKRALPKWLMEDADFLADLDLWFNEWFGHRPSGMDGLQSFALEVHEQATRYTANRIVVAKTPLHKLEIGLAALRALTIQPIDERRIARLCAADSGLQDIIVLDVDLGNPANSSVSADVVQSLRVRCSELAAEAISDESMAAEAIPDVSPTLRDRHQCEATLQRLKKLKEGKRSSCCELWDEGRNEFTSDRRRMGEIIQDAALERSGSDGAFEFAGGGCSKIGRRT